MRSWITGSRVVIALVIGLVLGVVMTAGAVLAFQSIRDDAQAQTTQTWQIAGPPNGFYIETWGKGFGPERSLDDWIRSIPASCDIQLIEQGLQYTIPYYRCPDS